MEQDSRSDTIDFITHCNTRGQYTSICASSPSPTAKEWHRDRGCLCTQWDTLQKKKLELRDSKSFIMGTKPALPLPRGRHYLPYWTTDKFALCSKGHTTSTFQSYLLDILKKTIWKSLFIKHAETQMTWGELSPNKVHYLFLHCLGFWQILPWVGSPMGHFDWSDQQRLQPNPLTLSRAALN